MQPQKIAQLIRRRPGGKGSDNTLELTKPEREGIETEPEEILRWEDDGGQITIVRGEGPIGAPWPGREEYF